MIISDNNNLIRLYCDIITRTFNITPDTSTNYLDIPRRNCTWYNAGYNYNGKELIHFTSLKVLFSIINEGALRMYNLINPNDKNEMNLANDIIKYYKNTEGLKDSLYYSSFSSVENIDDSYLWCNYGHKEEGVCIVFEILENQVEWNNSHISDIKYVTKLFDAFKDKRDRFIIEHNLSNDLDKEIIFGFYKLMCFHKEDKYIREKEIRLITQQCLSDTKPDCNSRNELVSYYELPLMNLKKNDNNKPQLKISKIILGNKLKDFPILRIEDILSKSFDYKIDVEVQKV